MKKFIIMILCSTAFGQQKGWKVYNSFNGGELSPLIRREDLTKYHSGLSLMENMIPVPQGAAEKRPGTKYVAEINDSSAAGRIIPFEYSTEDRYILLFENQRIQFFKDNAAINMGVGTESLGTLNNIVAHYLLNDNDVETTVLDDDGNTHDGTASTTTDVIHAEGYVGTGCFDLDGQYDIAIADADAWSFTDDLEDDPFSIVLWAYVTDYDNLQVLMSKWRDQSTTQEWRFSLSEDRKLQLHLVDSGIDLSGDMIAQYYLNDDAANTDVDDVSTNHDGSATTNTANLSSSGKINDSFDFDSTYAVEVDDDDELSFGDGTNDGPFSISVWVYYSTANSTTREILTKYDLTGDKAREYRLFIDSTDDVTLIIYDESEGYRGQEYYNLTSGWHHIVTTYNGDGGDDADDGIYIYIDGELKSSADRKSGAYVAMENTAAKMAIGASYDSGGSLRYFWRDKIDNLILFDTELTQSEVSTLYNSGSGIELLTSANVTISGVSDSEVATGWHQLAVTYSAPADETAAADGIIFYVDGLAVDSTATNDDNYTAMQNGAEEVRIGSQRNSGDSANEKFWADKIDEVSVFSDELSAAEVAGLYSTTPYYLDSPYLTADLFEINYEQSADVLYLTHPDYEPRKLSRYADAIWTLEASDITTGPFLDENTEKTYLITPSAVTGSITLTASGTDFRPFVDGTTAGHEPSGSSSTSKSQTGALFKFTQPIETGAYEETLSDNYTNDQAENTSWLDCGTIQKGGTWYLTTLGTWTGTIKVQRSYTIGAAHGATSWEDVPGANFQSNDDRNITTNATELLDEADYRVIMTASGDAAENCDVYFRISDDSQYGIVEITGVSSPTSATATVIKTLPNTNTTHRWAEGSWSNYRGWPKTVTFFQNRLTYGGNANEPDTIWLSYSGDYDDFTGGTDDDDALAYTLNSRQVNVIEWMIGKNKLVIGTSGAEWTLAGSGDDPLAASTVPTAEQHSTYGSAKLQATLAGESILFFQRGAEIMRELAYNWELDSYIAPEMTILADHITGDGITQTAYQKTPNPILWCIRDDGEIALFVYDRKELITSWSRIITDGTFESVAVISGDSEDEVWVVVNRTIDDSTVRYVEYFAPRYFGTDVDDAYFVDCGITYDSTATTTITGLGHLEGEVVAVLGDGAVQTSQTVSSGQITITEASTVQTGLPFTVQMKTMPLSAAVEGASILGRMKRVNLVIPQYYNSGDFYVGRDSSNKELLSISGMDTSDVDTDDRVTMPAGIDRYGYIYIYQQSPEPLTLTSIFAEYGVY